MLSGEVGVELCLSALQCGELLAEFGEVLGAAGEGGGGVGFGAGWRRRESVGGCGPSLRGLFGPVNGLGLRGVGAFLLLDQLGGEFLAAALGLLPVLPFGVALHQPGGRVGGNVGQGCLEPGVEFSLFGGDALAGFGDFGLAQLGGLPGLDQQLQLVAGGE